MFIFIPTDILHHIFLKQKIMLWDRNSELKNGQNFRFYTLVTIPFHRCNHIKIPIPGKLNSIMIIQQHLCNASDNF